jgi:aryl-alcohol dehydrogenase-like predicted oxidoreductase
MDLDLIPSLNPPSNTPLLSTVERSMQRLQMDHINGFQMRYLHPKENMNDYGSDIANQYSTAILRLMMNESNEDKMTLLISTVQAGIDYFGMYESGTSWSADGGHSLGRKLIIDFAAVMLDDSEMKSAVSNPKNPRTFDEDVTIKYQENAGYLCSLKLGLL